MGTLFLPLDPLNICVECAIALRRFLGGLDGVLSVEDQTGGIVIFYDEDTIDRATLARIAGESIRRLGY